MKLYALKRAVSILLIYVASLLFLAHLVIPHHHHDNIACFIVESDNEHHDNCCSHQEADHKQKHDTDQTNDCCVLNDIQALVPYHHKNEHRDLEVYAKDVFSSHFVALTFTSDAISEHFSPLEEFRQRPYCAFSYDVYATRSLGLRAPPCFSC